MSDEKTQEKKPRKPREMSEYQILPGSVSLRKIAAEVIEHLAEIQKYDEQIVMLVKAGIPEAMAREKWKAPQGFNNVHNLRKSLRLALHRPEISTDAIFLARLVEQIAPALGEKDVMKRRSKTQKKVEANEGVSASVE